MDDPFSAPEQLDQLNSTELAEIEVFKSWIGFVIFSSVCGFFAGLVVGVVIGAIMGGAGYPIELIKIAGGVAGFVIGLPISYFFFRRSVKKLLENA